MKIKIRIIIITKIMRMLTTILLHDYNISSDELVASDETIWQFVVKWAQRHCSFDYSVDSVCADDVWVLSHVPSI
jgi:hypothetical protein